MNVTKLHENNKLLFMELLALWREEYRFSYTECHISHEDYVRQEEMFELYKKRFSQLWERSFNDMEYEHWLTIEDK